MDIAALFPKLLDQITPLIEAAYWRGAVDGALATAVLILILMAAFRGQK